MNWNYLQGAVLISPNMQTGLLGEMALLHQHAQKGGKVMRMLGVSTQELSSAKATPLGGDMSMKTLDIPAEVLPQSSKLRVTIEKKIENIWLEFRISAGATMTS